MSVCRTHLARPQCLGRKRRALGLTLLLCPDALKNLIGNGHRHATEVRYQMNTVSMAGEAAFCKLTVSNSFIQTSVCVITYLSIFCSSFFQMVRCIRSGSTSWR